MNIQKFTKSIILLVCLIITNNNTIFFLNRFLIPEFISQPYVSYRRSYQSISLQPFVMTSNIIHMKNFYGINESFRGIYEIDGNYHATVIDQSLMNAGVTDHHTMPSEWLYNRLFIPIKLNGNIQTSGLAWHISTEVYDNIFLGWSSAVCSAFGVIDFNIKPEDEKVVLSQGYISDVLDTYRNLNKQLRNASNYMQDYTFADQDMYMRYEWHTDFAMFMQRIKGAIQLGCIIPSALEKNIFNPASYMVGTDGHWGLYGSGILDLVLKEDIILGFNLKVIGQFSKTKMVRIPLLNESSRYGSVVCWMNVNPGITTLFSPYLTVEGLRDGLGGKLSYQVVYHQDDAHSVQKNYNILDKKPLPTIDIDRLNRLSGWAQEHVAVSVFYDFMRVHEEHDAEPFLGFTAYIPVDWFFSKASAKTYGLSASVEILY
jgi:hypothetical protein